MLECSEPFYSSRCIYNLNWNAACMWSSIEAVPSDMEDKRQTNWNTINCCGTLPSCIFSPFHFYPLHLYVGPPHKNTGSTPELIMHRLVALPSREYNIPGTTSESEQLTSTTSLWLTVLKSGVWTLMLALIQFT